MEHHSNKVKPFKAVLLDGTKIKLSNPDLAEGIEDLYYQNIVEAANDRTKIFSFACDIMETIEDCLEGVDSGSAPQNPEGGN